MQHVRFPHPIPAHPPIPNPSWAAAVFAAKASSRGGILRRAVRDVEREIGREAFIAEVQQCGLRLIVSGGQFIVICNQGQIKLIC